MIITCDNCSDDFTCEEIPRRGSVCFKCHLKGIRIGFTHGKEEFSGPTVGERQRKIIADAAKDGRTVEPVGSRWV